MNDTLDRWVQRLTLATLVALAATLLTVGVVLYASSSQASAPAPAATLGEP